MARFRRARARATLPIAAVAVALAASTCARGALFGHQYEYEEDLTLDLDGSAVLTVNASIPALVALRGLALDPGQTRLDRDRIRALYETDVTDVVRVSRSWRRDGRLFVQVRVDIPDVRRLGEAPPFAWSHYELSGRNGEHVYRQIVGPSALRPGTLQKVGWDGTEIVGFRLHLPSRIKWHNSRDLETNEPAGIQRGNILAWEQALADRLDGRPIAIEVRMDSESILYRTLWLFAGAFAAAVLLIVGLIWWTMRKGAPDVTEPSNPAASAHPRQAASATHDW
jgi:hypothetical protein